MRLAARFLDRHRRSFAAICAAGSVLAILAVLAPAAPPTATVLVAARDLTAGSTVTASDLRRLSLPPVAVPSGALAALADVAGRSLALPMRRGEVVTDVRLAGSPLLTRATAGGLVGVPVRIADAAAVALLRAGDHVDVLGAAETQPSAVVIAGNALVVSVPEPADARDAGVESGALVVLATTAETSLRLAQAAIGSRLSVVLRS